MAGDQHHESSGDIPPLQREWEGEVYGSNRASALDDAENHIHKAIKVNGGHRFADEAEEHLQTAAEHVRQAIMLYQAAVALEVMYDEQ